MCCVSGRKIGKFGIDWKSGCLELWSGTQATARVAVLYTAIAKGARGHCVDRRSKTCVLTTS